MIDLKKRPDHFSFLINIPSLYERNFREIPLTIMGLLEAKPGFHSVDVVQSSADSRHIKIDIWDKYTMEQISVAQAQILEYFSK